MFHLLILAIIETLYIDIQIFVYLNDGKTIIFGKASFYHSFHCKIVDSMKVSEKAAFFFCYAARLLSIFIFKISLVFSIITFREVILQK